MVLKTTKTTCSITGFQSLDVINSTPAYSQIQTFTGDYTTNFFGEYTAMSQDGNYLVISEYGYSTSRGQVMVYLWNGSQYVLQTTISGTTAGHEWGRGVALNSDGTYLAISTRSNSPTNNYGSVRIYIRSGTSWTLQQVIQSGVAQIQTAFGRSMSFSTVGDQLIIGDNQEGTSNLPGAIYMFSRTGSTWTQDATFKGSFPAHFGLGVSVDTNSTGNIAVSGVGGGTTGASWYTRSGSTWTYAGSIAGGESICSLTNDGNYWSINNEIYYPVNTWSSFSSAGTFQRGIMSKDGNYFINQSELSPMAYSRNVNNWDFFASYFTYPAGGFISSSNLTSDRFACFHTVPADGFTQGIVSIIIKN